MKKKNILENAQKFVDGKIDKVVDNGILVLNYMNEKERESIYKVISKIYDIKAFEIKDDKGKRIVLKFKPYNEEKKNYRQLKELGDEFFKDGEYEESIKLYKEILENSNKNYSYIYSRLAFSYLKLKKVNIALDYLTVASYLRKQENKNDYDDLIINIQENISMVEKKPFIKLEENDFHNDLIENYGIDDIDKIVVLEKNGLSVHQVSEELNLTKEEETKVLIFLAKKYYSEGLDFKADNYMKKIEKIKNKSKETISLYEEVKKNKKFYKHRK